MATIKVSSGFPFSSLYTEGTAFILADESGIATYKGEMTDEVVKHWESLGYSCEEVEEEKKVSLADLTKK